jgi:ATP-binding cassette subfamily C (CFTR/MRP) protein 4
MALLIDHLYSDNLQLRIRLFAIKMRTAFTSLIYREILKMSSSQIEKTSVGKIITLTTKDVDEFEHAISYFTYMFNSFVHILVVCYVLYTEVGWLVITFVSVFTIVISIQGICIQPGDELLLNVILVYLTSLLIPLKTQLLRKTDERYQITKEILNGIKPLKCNVWGDVFKRKVFKCRK